MQVENTSIRFDKHAFYASGGFSYKAIKPDYIRTIYLKRFLFVKKSGKYKQNFASLLCGKVILSLEYCIELTERVCVLTLGPYTRTVQIFGDCHNNQGTCRQRHERLGLHNILLEQTCSNLNNFFKKSFLVTSFMGREREAVNVFNNV